MRITNSMISRSMLMDLNNNLLRLSDIERQVTTGKRIAKLSDDPIGSITSIQLRSKLNRISQYQENVQSAQEYLQQVETNTNEMNSIIVSAYESAINLASDYNESDRAAVAEKIGQYRDHILELGNASFLDTYMFGGYNTTTRPFSLDASGKILYNGVDMSNAADPDLLAEGGDTLKYEIGMGMRVEVGFTGVDFMGTGEDNVYNLLNDLYNALKGDSSAEEISAYAGKLLDAQDRVLANLAEIGGRTNRLDLMEARYEQDTLNFKEMQSNNDDIDITEAIVNFYAARTVYSYALQVGAQTMDTSLINFLK